MEIMQNNPNATVAVGTSPIAIAAVWLISYLGHITLEPELAAAVGALSVACVLFFFQGLKKASAALWKYGIKGCCKRLWGGRGGPAGA